MTTTRATSPTAGEAGALHIRVERRDWRSVLVDAAGHIPYAARQVPGRPGWVRVVLVQTIAGPLAGDRLRIDVEVGAGAAVEVVGNAAMLALPCAETARHDVRLRVATGGRIAWLPEILSAGCDFDASLTLELDAGAAALTREKVVLGRFGEQPGRYRSRLRCELAGMPLLHDEIRIDGREQATAAVLDGAAAFGSLALLGVEPDDAADPDELRLAGPGRVLRVLAPEAATLRTRLAAAEDAWWMALAEPAAERARAASG
jgi:urease accessory protein